MLPEGWRQQTLGSVSRIVTGGTPSRSKPEYWGGDVPWMSSGEVNQRTVRHVAERITALGVVNSNARPLPPGTIMMALNGQGKTRGKVALLEIETACNQSLAGIIPDGEKTSAEYLFHYLDSLYRDIRNITGDDARNGLNLKILASIDVVLPPLDEQRQIAGVLRSADEAIRTAELAASGAKSARMALLADLLHQADWEPERALPSGWHTPLLDMMAKRGSGHTPSKQFSSYWNGDVKWISLQDTKRLDRVYITDTAAMITPEGLANSSAVLHPANTVVVSRDATVGRSAIMTSNMAVSQHFISYTCGPALSPLYLYYWLQRMKPVFERIGAGSTIKTIGLPFFKGLKIAIPDRTEQDRTAELLWQADSQVFAAEEAIDKLRLVKAAVSDDLLSGRVRVPA